MDISKIRTVGTREEVYKGLASRTAGNLQKGKINNYEKPMITSQSRMSDSYVRPQMAQTMLGAFLIGLISVIAYSILKRRYFSE